MRALVALSCLGACSLTSGVAQSGVTTLGSNCVERWLGPNQVGSNNFDGVLYTETSIMSAGYESGLSTVVVCPISVDHDLGTQAEFDVRVYDGSSPGNYSCQAMAYDATGTWKGASGEVSSSGFGTQTLTLVINNVNPTSSWTFSILCKIPGNPSQLQAIRAY